LSRAAAPAVITVIGNMIELIVLLPQKVR